MKLPCLAILLTGLASAQAPGNPYGFADWHADFPGQLDLPTRNPGRYYDRSRTQALEQVIANLAGNTRREVWQMATEFFYRAPEDAVEPLIEAMDRASFGQPYDMMVNCIEAMGKMADERFDAALQRALEHKHEPARHAAYAALARSGSRETIAKCFHRFTQMDGRGRRSWLHAARLRLGDQAVAMFQQLMTPQMPMPVRDEILHETLKMPDAQAAAVLRGIWPHAVGQFKVIIAGVLHAAGDAAGTALLHELLTGEEVASLPQAVLSAGRGGKPGELRDDLLRLIQHPRAEVRLALVAVLEQLSGEDIDRALEVLADPNEPVWDIKSRALRALTARGRGDLVASLLDEVKTATGTHLDAVMNLLSASGDARAFPLMLERFRKAPPGEGRPFLQAIGHSRNQAAFAPLAEVFLGPEVAIGDPQRRGGALTTRNYVPTLLLNLPDIGQPLLQLFASLPREDYQRRALVLNTLNGLAAQVEDDDAARQRLVAPLREVMFDRSEAPQMRIWALSLLLRKSLTLDDAMRIKRDRADETPKMQAFWNDFLNEYF